jgi:hypothetical protein
MKEFRRQKTEVRSQNKTFRIHSDSCLLFSDFLLPEIGYENKRSDLYL